MINWFADADGANNPSQYSISFTPSNTHLCETKMEDAEAPKTGNTTLIYFLTCSGYIKHFSIYNAGLKPVVIASPSDMTNLHGINFKYGGPMPPF